MEEAIQQTDVALQGTGATEVGAGAAAQPIAAAGTAEDSTQVTTQVATQATVPATENVPAETGQEIGADENAENSAELKSFEKGFGIVHESGAGENVPPAEGQKNPGEAASVGTAPVSAKPPNQGTTTPITDQVSEPTNAQATAANTADAVHADAAKAANAAPAEAVNGTQNPPAETEPHQEQAEAPKPPRDWNAGFRELAEAHPEIVGQQIPQDIFQELMKSDLPPVRVYEGMMIRKLDAQVKALQQENRTLKQNAEAAARAPVLAQTGAPVQSPKEDTFLKGFNAWVNDRR